MQILERCGEQSIERYRDVREIKTREKVKERKRGEINKRKRWEIRKRKKRNLREEEKILITPLQTWVRNNP